MGLLCRQSGSSALCNMHKNSNFSQTLLRAEKKSAILRAIEPGTLALHIGRAGLEKVFAVLTGVEYRAGDLTTTEYQSYSIDHCEVPIEQQTLLRGKDKGSEYRHMRADAYERSRYLSALFCS